MELAFTAPEYQADGDFRQVHYVYRGNPEQGWQVYRAKQLHLELGPGYRALPTAYCGVCATDLARRFLPFPLPQITGHEVAAFDADSPVAVEINASHLARDVSVKDCAYCAGGLHIHCPERITLGIDRLPGGFAPYVLAPVNAVVPAPDGVNALTTCFTEPLAAAMHAVDVTPPQPGDQVAVLGPRRLGMLVLAALVAYRREHQVDFSITAVLRHGRLQQACLALGADETLLLHGQNVPKGLFHIVFDTTGSPNGFQSALQLSCGKVHIKSTHGQAVFGLHHISDMVVDEIGLSPWTADLSPVIDLDRRPRFFMDPAVNANIQSQLRQRHREALFSSSLEDAENAVYGFDFVVVDSLKRFDEVVRPQNGKPLVRPGGRVVLGQDQADNALAAMLLDGPVEIDTSRCGPFDKAMGLLGGHPDLVTALHQHWLTKVFALNNIDKAFELAADSRQAIKTVVQTNA